MNLLIGAVTIGLLLALLALGVFLSYRVYDMLDLTVDGSFGSGPRSSLRFSCWTRRRCPRRC